MIGQCVNLAGTPPSPPADFVRGFRGVYPTTPLGPAEIEIVYDRVRCGMFHNGYTKRGVSIDGEYKQTWDLDRADNVVKLNPHLISSASCRGSTGANWNGLPLSSASTSVKGRSQRLMPARVLPAHREAGRLCADPRLYASQRRVVEPRGKPHPGVQAGLPETGRLEEPGGIQVLAVGLLARRQPSRCPPLGVDRDESAAASVVCQTCIEFIAGIVSGHTRDLPVAPVPAFGQASGKEACLGGGGAYPAGDDLPGAEARDDVYGVGADFLDRQDPERLTGQLVKRLESLGHKVTLEPRPAA
jgi:hypothetical protein